MRMLEIVPVALVSLAILCISTGASPLSAEESPLQAEESPLQWDASLLQEDASLFQAYDQAFDSQSKSSEVQIARGEHMSSNRSSSSSDEKAQADVHTLDGDYNEQAEAVVKTHPSGLTEPSSAERRVANDMIAWLTASKLAVKSAGTIITADKIPNISSNLKYLNTFRLDYQGPDSQYKPQLDFSRFAIQYNRKGKQVTDSAVQFTTLHIQKEFKFSDSQDTRQVRHGFIESLNRMKDIWIADKKKFDVKGKECIDGKASNRQFSLYVINE